MTPRQRQPVHCCTVLCSTLALLGLVLSLRWLSCDTIDLAAAVCGHQASTRLSKKPCNVCNWACLTSSENWREPDLDSSLAGAALCALGCVKSLSAHGKGRSCCRCHDRSMCLFSAPPCRTGMHDLSVGCSVDFMHPHCLVKERDRKLPISHPVAVAASPPIASPAAVCCQQSSGSRTTPQVCP